MTKQKPHRAQDSETGTVSAFCFGTSHSRDHVQQPKTSATVQTQILYYSSLKWSDLEQLTAGPWNDLNTSPPKGVLALGLSPHALVMPGWLWVLSLVTFGLAPMYTHQFGFGLEKKHWKELKLTQHTRKLTSLSAHLFVLWNPDLPESQLPLPGLCWSAWQKCPFHCLSHTCVCAQEKQHSYPLTRPTGWSSDECISKRNTQTIARPCQEGSYCTLLW